MSKSITQDMRYRQSLMQYAAKYGVSRASRKYNKSRFYIYFWKTRWDGTRESLACQSRRPRSGTEDNPGHAPPQSHPGHGGTVAPAAPASGRGQATKPAETEKEIL